MKDKIEQAKQQLGLTDKELSLKLGYGDRYIARKLKTPPSAKTQELIICRINKLLGESEVVALKKELEHKNQVLDKRNDLLADAEYRINALEKTVKHLQTVLNEKTDRIRALKNKILNERVAFGLFVGVLIIFGLLVWSL